MAQDIFLKFEGPDLKGESKDDKHKDEIEVESVSFGVSQTGTFGSGTGGAAGKANFSAVTVMIQTNKSSPELWWNCATGQHFNKATLTFRKAGGKAGPIEYYKVTMEPCMLTAHQVSGSKGDSIMMESFSLDFGKCTIEYSPQKEDGTADAPITHWWDQEANKNG